MGKDKVISLWCELAFIVSQKLRNKIYKLEKDDYRIPILQLARFRSRKPNENKAEINESRNLVLNRELGSRLDWKIVETI